jgi:hypothetical protein
LAAVYYYWLESEIMIVRLRIKIKRRRAASRNQICNASECDSEEATGFCYRSESHMHTVSTERIIQDSTADDLKLIHT